MSCESIISNLLASYNLMQSELELYYPGAKAVLDEKNEAMIARLVRVAATNKAMLQSGLSTIIGSSSDHNDDDDKKKREADVEEESNSCCELTPDELSVLAQSDGGGLVLGIPVGWHFYWRVKSMVNGKKMRLLAKTNPELFKHFIMKHLKRLAKQHLRRESLLGLLPPTIRS